MKNKSLFSSSVWFDLLCVLLGAVVLLLGIGASQLSPHHLTVSINGHVLADQWLTNNIEVQTLYRDEVTSNGIVPVPYYQTNELWHIWRIFR